MPIPAVSIIVPNYNHSKYLERRFASIFGQTYQDFEVIILDDCSTDNSREIIERQRSNPKVSAIVYNDINSASPFKQWDKGIQMAQGDYIWIAESDDSCEPSFLETVMSHIRKTRNCVLAYCNVIDIDKDGRFISRQEYCGRDRVFSGKSFVVNTLLLGNCVRNASSAVFKRSMALSVSKEWTHSRGAGDYYLWVMILSGKGKVCKISKCLDYRRIHDSNVTHKAESSGSNLADERETVDFIYRRYHIPFWRKIIAENYRRNRIYRTKFDNEDIKRELLSIWHYGSKMVLLSKFVMKIYFTSKKITLRCRRSCL